MRKETVFLGYDENEKEIIQEVNVYTKQEMIEIFKNHEKEIIEKYKSIEIGAPRDLKVAIEIIYIMDKNDEFIFNDVTNEIEMYMI